LILTDDVGFGATSTFGEPIQTPNFQRLADNGLRCNKYHTTALCSPTRAALISVASGVITEFATGITANLASQSDKRWTVPVGAGIGRLFTVGTQPMSLKFEAYYNPVRTSGGAVWTAQLTLTFLFAR
jgi:arylsulfatase A-like enzyme